MTTIYTYLILGFIVVGFLRSMIYSLINLGDPDVVDSFSDFLEMWVWWGKFGFIISIALAAFDHFVLNKSLITYLS